MIPSTCHSGNPIPMKASLAAGYGTVVGVTSLPKTELKASAASFNVKEGMTKV